MDQAATPAKLWTRWLVAACLIVMFYGLALMGAPRPMLSILSLIYFSSSDHFMTFAEGPQNYILIAHGVLGSVIFGWGLTLLFVVTGPFQRGSSEGWRFLALSLLAWSVSETMFSIVIGSTANLFFSLAFAGLFVVPLIATYSQSKAPG
jgi:hypothetical protein